jgi:hypothetical protein
MTLCQLYLSSSTFQEVKLIKKEMRFYEYMNEVITKFVAPEVSVIVFDGLKRNLLRTERKVNN